MNADVRIVQRYIFNAYMCPAAGAEGDGKGDLYYEALAAIARLVLPHVERERGTISTLTPARVMKILRGYGIVIERGSWKCTGFWKLVGTFASFVTVAAGPIPGWRHTCPREALVHVLKLASTTSWWKRALRDAFTAPRKSRRG